MLEYPIKGNSKSNVVKIENLKVKMKNDKILFKLLIVISQTKISGSLEKFDRY